MHLVSQPMRFVSLSSRERYDQQSCLRTVESNLSSYPNDVAAQASLEWLKSEMANLHLPDGLPVGLCHCNLTPTNFLYSNGVLVAMLDFDMASCTHLLYDVANLLYWWANPGMSGEHWQKRAKELLFAYEAVRHLTAQEKFHLYDIFKFVFLMNVSWFIQRPDEAATDRKGVHLLNSLGRAAFQSQIVKSTA